MKSRQPQRIRPKLSMVYPNIPKFFSWASWLLCLTKDAPVVFPTPTSRATLASPGTAQRSPCCGRRWWCSASGPRIWGRFTGPGLEINKCPVGLSNTALSFGAPLNSTGVAKRNRSENAMKLKCMVESLEKGSERRYPKSCFILCASLAGRSAIVSP